MVTTVMKSVSTLFFIIAATQFVCILAVSVNEEGKDSPSVDRVSGGHPSHDVSEGYVDLGIQPDDLKIPKADRFFDPMDPHSPHMGMEPSLNPFAPGHHHPHDPAMGMGHGHHDPHSFPGMGFFTPEPSFGGGHHDPHTFPGMGFFTPEPSFGFSFPLNRPCLPHQRQSELQSIRQDIEDSINLNPELAARYVRIAFHDCITKPTEGKSGCNGSIRLRQESGDQVGGPYSHVGHSKLSEGVQKIIDIIGSHQCMTVADGVLYAMAIAIQKAGGPDVIDEIVDVNHPRRDVSTPDVLQGELPEDHDSFDKLLSNYERKGLTKRDLIASSVGGHSLGGLREDTHIDFTTDPLVFSTTFACNLVQRHTSLKNLDGFHTLQSDNCLVLDGESLDMLRVYAGCTDPVQECTCGGASTPERAHGLQELKKDYGAFLIKLASL